MNILHLCDLHYSAAAKEEFETRIKKISAVISGLPVCWKPDVAVIAGDIVCSGSKYEFNGAQKIIRRFFSEITVNDIVCCPGNHDGVFRNGTGDFRNYEKFCAMLGADFDYAFNSCEGISTLHGIDFCALNSCRYADTEHADRAVCFFPPGVTASAAGRKLFGVIHHPPERYVDRSGILSFTSYCLVVFCGHAHPPVPVIRRIGRTVYITGIGVLPDNTTSKCGCQIVKVQADGYQKTAIIASENRKDMNISFDMING